MNSKMYLSKRENIRIGSIICLYVVYFLFPSRQMLMLMFYWALSLLTIGNAKRVPKNRPTLYIIRMTMYFLIYAIPFFVEACFGDIGVFFRTDEILLVFACTSIVLFAYMVWLVLNRTSIMLLMSKEYAAFTNFIEKKVIFLRIYSFIGSAICEELFFRGYILSILAPQFILLPISIALFVLAHVALPWGEMYTKKDITLQFFIGIINGLMFLFAKTIIPGVILHLLINCTVNSDLFVKLDRWYLRKKHYDQIAERIEAEKSYELEL